MTPEQLSKILDDLGQRLGPAGQHVYDVLIRQAVLAGVIQIVAGLAVLALLAAVLIVDWKLAQRERRKYSDGGGSSYSYFDPSGYLMVAGFAAVLGLVFAALFLAFGFMALLNPEYSAIRDLLGAVGR